MLLLLVDFWNLYGIFLGIFLNPDWVFDVSNYFRYVSIYFVGIGPVMFFVVVIVVIPTSLGCDPSFPCPVVLVSGGFGLNPFFILYARLSGLFLYIIELVNLADAISSWLLTEFNFFFFQ